MRARTSIALRDSTAKCRISTRNCTLVFWMAARRGGSSGSRPKPWELYGPTWEGYAPPEDPDRGGWDEDPDPGLEEEGPISPATAGENLAQLLLQLKLQGSLSSHHVCVLAYWASAAGAVGPCKAMGLRPGAPSGNYQRKLNSFMEIEKDDPLYTLRVPGLAPELCERTVHHIEVENPHEVVAKEVAEDPSILQLVAAGQGQAEWAQAYRRHPVVQAAGPAGGVVPLALYIDGVPYSKADTFLGIWVYNLVTYKRHLVCVLRKSRLCACGCRKWCSLWEVFRWLAWSFGALATGLHPAARHDARPWDFADHDREVAAGSPLGVRGALVLLKGDWAEFCLSFGFPTWTSNSAPCLFCCSSKGELYKVAGLTGRTFPHALKTAAGYLAACEGAEKWVLLTQADHAALLPLLAYDRRKEPNPEIVFLPVKRLDWPFRDFCLAALSDSRNSREIETPPGSAGSSFPALRTVLAAVLSSRPTRRCSCRRAGGWSPAASFRMCPRTRPSVNSRRGCFFGPPGRRRGPSIGTRSFPPISG